MFQVGGRPWRSGSHLCADACRPGRRAEPELHLRPASLTGQVSSRWLCISSPAGVTSMPVGPYPPRAKQAGSGARTLRRLVDFDPATLSSGSLVASDAPQQVDFDSAGSPKPSTTLPNDIKASMPASSCRPSQPADSRQIPCGSKVGARALVVGPFLHLDLRSIPEFLDAKR